MNQASKPSLVKYQLVRVITLLCYFTLLAMMLFGAVFLGPEGVAAKLVLWLLISSGLLLIIKGLIAGKRRSYIWLCYILLMYFVFCVQFLFSGGGNGESTAAWHEIVAMTAIVTSFCTAIIASRLTPIN
jgi:uncharacterized membrane protein